MATHSLQALDLLLGFNELLVQCGNLLLCLCTPKKAHLLSQRERERLQCFSQPASLITYRRRQRSNVKNIKTVQNELENLHMILLCKKGSHGVCVRGKQRSIPLPNCLESWTLKNHVQFICNSHTTTMCADPIGSGNMLTPSKTPENNTMQKQQIIRVGVLLPPATSLSHCAILCILYN